MLTPDLYLCQLIFKGGFYMLKHFVIFTFEEKFFKEEHFNEYVDAFSRIKEEYPKSKKFQFTKIVLIVLLIWI